MLFVWATGCSQFVYLWPDLRLHALLVCALTLLFVGMLALTTFTSDPLPWRPTVFLVAMAPVNSALVFFPSQSGDPASIWIIQISGYVMGLLALRGRQLSASIGVVGLVSVALPVMMSRGLSIGDAITLLALPVSALGTGILWRYTLERAGRRIIQHRTGEQRAAVREQAVRAAIQQARADAPEIRELVGPLLSKIEAGKILTDAELARCELLGSQLRARIR